MAAGVGSRISRHLQNQPKCCVEIQGKPLIKHAFELLNRKDISNIALVTGYQEKYIHQALEGFQYARYYNPFFRVANSISSVWFARDFLSDSDDILIMNADVFMEEKVLDVIINEDLSPVFLCDSTRIESADFRFQWEGNELKKYGKELNNKETTGEYVGIAKLKKQDIISFRRNVVDAVLPRYFLLLRSDMVYQN